MYSFNITFCIIGLLHLLHLFICANGDYWICTFKMNRFITECFGFLRLNVGATLAKTNQVLRKKSTPKSKVIMFLVGLLLSASVAVVFSETSLTAPVFTINMDEPANVRWSKPCAHFGAIDALIYDEVMKLLPDSIVDDLEAIMANWYDKNAREPYKSEMAYFAECSSVPLGGIVTMNLIYDMTAFCTSIVAENADGVILHGRNLDYGGIPLLRNATMVAQFTDNTGVIHYTGTTFFGYSGFWTGVKPNAFSISADERNQGSIAANVHAIQDDWYPPSWLIRDLVADPTLTQYSHALQALVSTKLMAPVYFIVGGLNFPDGAVVTRNQTHSFNLWPLETSYLGWYDVETNYDWWTPPPKHDDRRDPAIQSMNAMGQANCDAMGIYDVLSQPPVLNSGTLYTTIMSASNASLYYTMVRFP